MNNHITCRINENLQRPDLLVLLLRTTISFISSRASNVVISGKCFRFDTLEIISLFTFDL